MKSGRLLKHRVIASVIGGVFFLVESLNPEFLRPAVQSRTILVHVFLVLFGAAMLVQAYILYKQLKAKNST
jgi:uncharacterized membrane protein